MKTDSQSDNSKQEKQALEQQYTKVIASFSHSEYHCYNTNPYPKNDTLKEK